MSDAFDYKAIIVGAGQAGGPLAGALSQAGWRVALIEKAHVGGTCVNEGCTPTKTMIASARVAHLSRRAADYGVHTSEISVNQSTIRQRKREIVTSFREGSQKSLEQKENVDLIFGTASFVDPHTIKVVMPGQTNAKHIRGEIIVLNTGQRPVIPEIDGLNNTPYLTSSTIMELAQTPGHLIVMGGGYIGLEFAQMFRRFGANVTIVQRAKQLAPREDTDVAEELTQILRDEGIRVLLSTNVTRTQKTSTGVSVHVTNDDGEQILEGTHLLVATGRQSNTEALNLQAAGVALTGRGDIDTKDSLQTSVKHIYALGDVKGGPAFTHISYDDYRILKNHLLHDGDTNIKNRMVPYTLFTDPQLGRIGLSEQQAKDAGYNIKIAKLPMSSVARAIETDETKGFMKAVIDADTHKILGAAILGLEGGEIASVIQVAMMGDLPFTALRDSPFSHPTLAESLNNLFMKVDA